ncbi:hypothetical protein [Salmonirosea aquatica]|uniref:Uncharacterized protein n=1 Tax=Salmonirosea aquatica TaxID=2654236 RepID=A0A7C9BT45_9BACT|nr:hypothetical protein [Cytophagaceae bacterium SJW1-29]
MQTLTLKTESSFNNLAIDLNKVKRIKLDVDNPLAPKLWILYFYGQSRDNKECVIRIWFFNNAYERTYKLRNILNQYPHIQLRYLRQNTSKNTLGGCQ